VLKQKVDNQLVQLKIPIQRIAITLVAIASIIWLGILGVHLYRISDPYIHEVLSLKGDLVKGHAIFQINCSGCHGIEADGIVGPSLRDVAKHKSKFSLIQQVISGQTPPMPKFQPSSQEMADLLSYLEQL
jgi:mono/diheme cytochrome c family protein